MSRALRVSTLVLAFVLAVPMYALEPGAPRLHSFRSTKPDDLWTQLRDSNKRYVAGRLIYPSLIAQRNRTREHQHPPVTILSCADSRVPPELIFDRSVGDLFVARVAGNIADPFILGSIEYAIAKGYTSLVIVMGHQSCGAVDEALKATDPPTPSLIALVTRIRESFKGHGELTLKEGVEINARYTAKYLVDNSDVIKDAVAGGKVKIMAAYYSFDGHVTPLD